MKYRTIVADPPWPMPDSGNRTLNGRDYGPSRIPYSTMTLEEITSLPLRQWAATSAHLYLWTTNRFLENAYSIVRGWGFKPSTLLAWCKPPKGQGLGGAFPINTEHILFCRRGQLRHHGRATSNWWLWPRGMHSAKPEAFLDLVERVSPGPYLELFARRNRLGWDTWGNEALNHIDLGGAS